MSIAEFPAPTSDENQSRKPRMAIMGEFSAGKSTLTNLLIGSEPLPVKVTATQLPPVWIAYGDAEPYREDMEGNPHPIDLHDLANVSLDETSLIRIFLKSDILELCDIIDMPGISDPNMPAEVWERVIGQADGVLWCTHATQAWRQSEAAVWKSLSPELRGKSFLLLTRYDKLLTEDDRERVARRVYRETEGLFAGLFPISLTNAIAAKDDRGLWELSGAEEFAHDLVDMLTDMSASLGRPKPMPAPRAAHVEPEARAAGDNVLILNDAIVPSAPTPARVMPSRVKVSASSSSGTKRPERSSSSTSWAETVRNGADADLVQTAPHQETS